jgi:hypothetical protein
MTKPVSEKQVAFLSTLLSERVNEFAVDFATLTSVEASRLIETLLGSPRKSGGSVERVTAEGMYRNAKGDIYKVQASRETGNLYAKRLDVLDGAFVYEQGALRNIVPSDRMTLEDAKAFGVQYGFCCVCARLLTNGVSVAEGIGPICGGRI